MGQVNAKMRSMTDGFSWYCPGCKGMHPLPSNRGWAFNGDLDRPTFTPSFRHSWKRFHSYTDAGVGVGEPFECVCHYIVTNGNVQFCGDSTHSLAGQTIPMPDLPEAYRDDQH